MASGSKNDIVNRLLNVRLDDGGGGDELPPQNMLPSNQLSRQLGQIQEEDNGQPSGPLATASPIENLQPFNNTGGRLHNWQATKTTVKERLSFLFNNEILCDVHFIVGKDANQQVIPAHKFVLSVGSAVFDAMFNGVLATKSDEVELPDVEPAAFLHLLKFLYSDEVRIGPESVMTTLYTAKKYAVAALEEHCVDFLKSNLGTDNAFLLLTQARLFDEPQLAALCLEMIDKNTADALNAEGFTDIDQDTLNAVLESAGGLVTAVAPVVIRGAGIWVGWPGIHLEDPNEKIPESDPKDKTPTAGLLSEKIVPIHAEPKLFDSYYNGCCNGTFWPLFHSMPDRATFIADHWKAYIKINEEFAEKTVRALHLLKQQKGKNGSSPPIVWVHDYHLMLAANWIRQRVEEDDIKCKLAFFLHIPFPPWDIFRLFPWSDELLQGILGCDMVGFHITDYCLNFIDCCQRNLGCRVDRKNLLVELGGRTICVRPLPIGVPFDRFVQLAQNAKPVLSTSQQIILGVDRLDYTKGLVHRLKAFERLLEKYPEHIEKVVLLQISVPSRTDVKEYQDLKEEMDQLVGRINGRFTTPNWSPIRYIYGCVGQDELAAFYRDAAVALVTPLRDGMNLVAKEFVACQINKTPGVLIVSPFAGAGEMMHEALICNPYELDDAAEVIHRALIMPEDERIVRMNHLRRREQLNDVDSWMKAFLKAMDSLEEEADDIGATSMQPVTIDDFDEYLSKYIGYTQKLALLLDYDGTLAPIAPHPDLATLPLETKHTLQRLSNMSDVYIAIISGRNVNNVKNMVGIEGITYAGNHGLEILHPDGSKFVHPMPMELQDKVVDLLKALQEQVCKDGAWVENKGALLTFHYRETPVAKRAALAEQARKLITAAGFTPAPAHCALEARPPVQWDKGRASIYILRTAFGLDWSERIRIIYAGDDVTDEDAMLALKGMAATFRIASSHITKTSAERRLSSTDSVLAMLKWVERHFSRRKPRANSLTYKSARKARDTIQMHMSYQLPPRTSPRHTPPRTPDKLSSGSDSS